MSTFSGNRTIKLWTCCRCRENGISMSLGECPKCEDHSRCYDCDVKSHAASDAEIEEENLKIARSASRDPSVARSRGQPGFEPESSRRGSNVTISSNEDEAPFATSISPVPPSTRSREQPDFELESSRAANFTISSGRVARTLPSGQTPLTQMSSSRLVSYLVYLLQILIGIGHSSERQTLLHGLSELLL
jgi:hypothetical protein